MSEPVLGDSLPGVRAEDGNATFDRQKKVLSMYSDNAKTYIHLSGAALALTITFTDSDLASSGNGEHSERLDDRRVDLLPSCGHHRGVLPVPGYEGP